MTQIGAMYMGGSFTPKSFGVAAERLGFDSLWAGDHVLHYVDGITTLGCFAGCTERITLGTSVLVAPFRPAATIAKALLTAAFIADRQIIAGIGPGGDVPAEFAAVGAEPRDRGAYTDEALDVIRLLWRGEPVCYEGRWNRFSDVHMLAAPDGERRFPLPLVWIGGRSDAALRRAVAYGSGYLPYLISPARLRERVSRLRELADEAGRPPEDITIGCVSFLIPAGTREEALDLGLSRVGFNSVTRENMAKFYLLGSAAECLEQVSAYIEAGATHVVLGCHGGAERQLEAYLSVSEEILAAMRRRSKSSEPR